MKPPRKNLIAILCIIAVLLLPVRKPASAEQQTITMYCIVSPGSVLNVRFSPEPNAHKEAYLERGDEVEVYYIKDGWACIKWGDTLYCKAEFLSYEPPMTPTQYTVTGSGRVRIRSSPGGDFVQWAHPGDQLVVHAFVMRDGQEWALVQQGAIMAEYLQ